MYWFHSNFVSIELFSAHEQASWTKNLCINIIYIFVNARFIFLLLQTEFPELKKDYAQIAARCSSIHQKCYSPALKSMLTQLADTMHGGTALSTPMYCMLRWI